MLYYFSTIIQYFLAASVTGWLILIRDQDVAQKTENETFVFKTNCSDSISGTTSYVITASFKNLIFLEIRKDGTLIGSKFPEIYQFRIYSGIIMELIGTG